MNLLLIGFHHGLETLHFNCETCHVTCIYLVADTSPLWWGPRSASGGMRTRRTCPPALLGRLGTAVTDGSQSRLGLRDWSRCRPLSSLHLVSTSTRRDWSSSPLPLSSSSLLPSPSSLPVSPLPLSSSSPLPSPSKLSASPLPLSSSSPLPSPSSLPASPRSLSRTLGPSQWPVWWSRKASSVCSWEPASCWTSLPTRRCDCVTLGRTPASLCPPAPHRWR